MNLDQLTGAALDRAACEALGIEPDFFVRWGNQETGGRGFKDKKQAKAWAESMKGLEPRGTRSTYRIEPVFPRVSDWESVRLLVEALEQMEVVWERTTAQWVKVYNNHNEAIGKEYGWAFPEALARAVVAWAKDKERA